MYNILLQLFEKAVTYFYIDIKIINYIELVSIITIYVHKPVLKKKKKYTGLEFTRENLTRYSKQSTCSGAGF